MFNRGPNIDIDEKIIRKNKIPNLHTDPDWIKLFGDSGDKDIEFSKKELVNIINKKKELEILEKQLQKDKSKYMKLILKTSDSVNNEKNLEDVMLLDQYKSKLLEANEKLEEIAFDLELMPGKIREANFKLLLATVDYGYRELDLREKELSKAVGELDSLRKRLQELIKIKHDNEEWIGATYIFLHGLLGSEITDKIDRKR